MLYNYYLYIHDLSVTIKKLYMYNIYSDISYV